MPLKVGDEAPAFEARDQHDQVRRSGEFAGKRFVIYFYPHDDTAVCTREACAFEEGMESFRDLDVRVIGVSPNGVGSHKRFAERHNLSFTLLSDRDRRVIADYDARGLLGRTTRVTYIVGPDQRVEAVHRAELSGRGHMEWARSQLTRLQATA